MLPVFLWILTSGENYFSEIAGTGDEVNPKK